MVGDASWPGGLPYRETENESPDLSALPDLWCTLQFDTSPTDDPIEVGPRPKTFEERGLMTLPVIARSGLGDTSAVAAADLARAAVIAWPTWPAGFHFELAGPGTLDSGADGSWFRVDIEISYRWQHVS